MNKILLKKYANLKSIIKNYGTLAIGFSGGVDSTLLCKVAADVIKNMTAAFTLDSALLPRRELAQAISIANNIGIKHYIVKQDIEPIIYNNPPDRCYHCKKAGFSLLIKYASEHGFVNFADGQNIDDAADYRPGTKASKELNTISPFVIADFCKADIRTLAKELGLANWDKPAAACLASRIPYTERLDEKVLILVEKAEDFLLELGFKQCRVRCHIGKQNDILARVEVEESELQKFFEDEIRRRVLTKLKALGFDYVCMDIEGYNMGSLNKVILKNT